MKNKLIIVSLLASLFVIGCSAYSNPNERGEVAHGVVAEGQAEHEMKVKEQRNVIAQQEKTLERQRREFQDAKRQEEQNERMKRYGSEKDLSTFEGY